MVFTEYPIYHRGQEIGTLTATEDGLYWQLTAWCRAEAWGVQRLYGVDGLKTAGFGVLAPAGENLQLHRRLSRHSCPVLPAQWLLGREAEGYLPWMGTVEEQLVPDAMLRTEPEGQTLALPADLDPMPLAEYASQMQSLTLNGREYLTLRLRNGIPEETVSENQEA